MSGGLCPVTLSECIVDVYGFDSVSMCVVCLQSVGVVLLAVGCWYLADTRSVKLSDVGQEAGLQSLIHYAAIIMCVIGVIIILVALLGCVAASREICVCLIVVRLSLYYMGLFRSTNRTIQ